MYIADEHATVSATIGSPMKSAHSRTLLSSSSAMSATVRSSIMPTGSRIVNRVMPNDGGFSALVSLAICSIRSCGGSAVARVEMKRANSGPQMITVGTAMTRP